VGKSCHLPWKLCTLIALIYGPDAAPCRLLRTLWPFRLALCISTKGWIAMPCLLPSAMQFCNILKPLCGRKPVQPPTHPHICTPTGPPEPRDYSHITANHNQMARRRQWTDDSGRNCNNESRMKVSNVLPSFKAPDERFGLVGGKW